MDASISPDGKFVAFESDRNGPFHVWLDQIGAGNPVDLTPGPEDQRGPLRSVGFSHDGDRAVDLGNGEPQAEDGAIWWAGNLVCSWARRP